MNLFNIGPMELILILILALIIFGPGKLPEVARGFGKAISEFRRASQELTEGITKEINTTTEAPKESKESTETAADKDVSQRSTPESNKGDD